MREIKFRAWDKKENKIVYPEFIVENNYGVLIPAFLRDDYCYDCYIDEHLNYNKQDDIVIMQYIGMKDKNDRDIYEGDIIKHSGGEVGVAKFKDGCFGVELLNGDFLICVPFEHHSVIGNIYENPELLEVENDS